MYQAQLAFDQELQRNYVQRHALIKVVDDLLESSKNSLKVDPVFAAIKEKTQEIFYNIFHNYGLCIK